MLVSSKTFFLPFLSKAKRIKSNKTLLFKNNTISSSECKLRALRKRSYNRIKEIHIIWFPWPYIVKIYFIFFGCGSGKSSQLFICFIHFHNIFRFNEVLRKYFQLSMPRFKIWEHAYFVLFVDKILRKHIAESYIISNLLRFNKK